MIYVPHTLGPTGGGRDKLLIMIDVGIIIYVGILTDVVVRAHGEKKVSSCCSNCVATRQKHQLRVQREREREREREIIKWYFAIFQQITSL